jgi:uncharacterized phage-associated protein
MPKGPNGEKPCWGKDDNNPIGIANEFLGRGFASGRPLTQMQLQKLVYLAHGWSLAIFDRPLTSEKVQAWDFGPVYNSLYQALKRYGAQPVSTLITFADANPYDSCGGSPVRATLDKKQASLLDKVWDVYGRYEAFQLSALTHEPGTPWTEIYTASGKSAPIPDELIRRYFVSLATNKREGTRGSI